MVSPRSYVRIAWLALSAQLLIVFTGAAVRLTGSGLGCADWPSCEEDRFVAPLEGHALIEFGNRAMSGVVLLTVLLAIYGAMRRRPYRRVLLVMSLGLLVGVGAQIVLGGIVVRMELAPVSVVGHFIVSIALVWLATLLVERSSTPRGPAFVVVGPLALWASRVTVVASLVTITAGTLVTATGPHGGDELAERLTWFDIGEIVRVHAVAGLCLLAAALVATWTTRSVRGPLRSRAALLVAAIAVQVLIGYLQYFNGVPPLLVGLHIAGACLVWVAALRYHLGLFRRGRPGGSPPGPEGGTIEGWSQPEVPAGPRRHPSPSTSPA